MLEAKTARALAKKIKGTGWVMQQVLLTSKKNLTGGAVVPFVIQVLHPDIKTIVENEIEGVVWDSE